jgi:hypothetical protein
VKLEDAAGVGRRSLVKGAAWATPMVVVGVAAPAYAASGPCSRVTATLTGTKEPSTLTFPGSTTTATVSIVARDAGGNPTGLPGGGDAPGDTGDVRNGFVELWFDEPDDQMNYVITLTLTFSAPVTALSMRIIDIDKDNGDWIDDVFVGPAGFTAVKGANVSGAGTSASPFRSTVNENTANTNQAAHVQLTWPTAVTQVQVSYRAADLVGDSPNGQHIGIGELAFDNC